MIGLSVDMSRGCLWLSWTSTLQGELCPPTAPPPSLPPFIAAAKPTRAALHSEGLANMLTYRIWVGPSALRGKMASALSSPLSLNSFMTAGWLEYTEGLKTITCLTSPIREIPVEGRSKGTLRIGALKKR